jgi:riboflavin biosynthesis pyrimidine reductase
MLLRQLHPDPGTTVDTLDAFAVEVSGEVSGGSGAWHVRVNMVSSIDGAAAVEGRVGVLSGTADQVLLHELRLLCDVLLVGAGTIRAEGYGPLRVTSDQQQARTAAGLSPLPRLAVLTGSLDVDLAAPVFAQATARPVVVTTRRATQRRRDEAAEVADVVVAGEHDVDLREAVSALAQQGLRRVLSEGGPHVLAQLFAADLVDELCLALAPVVTAGDGVRITNGPPLPAVRRLALAQALEQDDYLFLRYRRP